MFKYVVTYEDKIHVEYGINRNEDDFIRFLPAHFTRQMGEEILPENIQIFMIPDSKKDLYEGKKAIHDSNDEILEPGPSLKICRVDKAKYKVGDKPTLDEYLKLKLEREEKFKDSKEKKGLKLKDPKSKKEIDAEGNEIDVVEILDGDELTLDEISLELELIGEEVSSWPYKEIKNNKGEKSLIFTGNK